MCGGGGGGQSCIKCKQMKGMDKNISKYRLPQDKRRQQWIEALELQETEFCGHHRVCNCHFPNGDLPSIILWKFFCSPKKRNSPRTQWASKRKNWLKPKHLHGAITTVHAVIIDSSMWLTVFAYEWWFLIVSWPCKVRNLSNCIVTTLIINTYF